ncbi:MAG: DEAD/DEAH box helicase, partial [Burkholderiales bacterium]
GRDVLACAMTGSGKTAAFLLPILQRLIGLPRGSTRALIIAPTRELAAQIDEHRGQLARHTRLTGAAVFGGVGMGPQESALRRGVDILVATPGRLLDHMRMPYAGLDGLQVLVLDEADRMLDMGFLPDIKRIIALLPRERQNLLFSATFPDEIRTLVKTLLRNPAEVQVAARNAAADSVTHVMHPVAREKKRELLAYLIQTRGLHQVLVFAGTRIGANRLAHQLRRDHIHADAIHGDKSQAEREAALADFKAGKTAVLVATDVASRGLDIEGLPQVINFDVPHSPEDYVHRCGRTGRAGLPGEAISLVSPQDMEAIAGVERLIKKRIERVLVPGFQPGGTTVAALMG